MARITAHIVNLLDIIIGGKVGMGCSDFLFILNYFSKSVWHCILNHYN